MDDQVGSDRELRRLHLVGAKTIASGIRLEDAAVEDVQARRRRRLRGAALRREAERQQRDDDQTSHARGS
jgi:hypothetical protein